MGLSPLQVGAMSLWEFAVAVDAFNRHHGGAEADELDGDEVDRLWAMVKGAG